MDLTFEERRMIAVMILNGNTEAAIELACVKYGVAPPKIRIGLPKKETRVYACYQPRNKTIYFANGELMRNPFVVTHELYHHLRIHSGKHRGTEKHADAFASGFIHAMQKP
jgi:Zn-dependent peptidase ImmA (M78 family)